MVFLRSYLLLLIALSLSSLWGAQPVLAGSSGEAHPLFVTLSTTLTSPKGFIPAQIRHAYGFDRLSCSFTKPWGSPALCGAGQTIAIVDAFDDPVIESDLATFDNQFGIPVCTTTNGCFTKATPQGMPKQSGTGASTTRDWAIEMSLDVEWAHAIAPGAKIVLVESLNNKNDPMFSAVSYAASLPGVHQVSMSWGSVETSSETGFDTVFQVPGVSFIASIGDSGNVVQSPGSSPWVVGVGGTSLILDNASNVISETAWSNSGGGISAYESEPPYQQNYGISSNSFRATPDVSYDADFSQSSPGFSVFDSLGAIGATGWFRVSGTSAGAPQWSALLAIVNSGRAIPVSSTSFGTDSLLYEAATGPAYATNYRDITMGTDGSCGSVCNAGPGYDFITGLGSPKANTIIPFLQGTD